MKTTLSALFGGAVLLVGILIIPTDVSAQTTCYDCSSEMECAPAHSSGSTECTQGSSSCSTSDIDCCNECVDLGAADLTVDGSLLGPPVSAPVAITSVLDVAISGTAQHLWSEPGRVRQRSCNGSIVARHYSAPMIVQLQLQSKVIRI